MSGGSGGGSTIIPMGTQERPKDLFTAISHLEIIFEAEKEGKELPEKFATFKDRLDYFNLGMRSIIGGAFLSILLAPLSSAVIGNHLPIFGDFNPSIMEKIIAYILSFGYTLAYMMLFIYIGKLRGNTISNIISFNLIMGMTLGIIIKFFITALLYGFIDFIILTPDNLSTFFNLLKQFKLSSGAYNLINYLVIALKESLIPAIYIFFYTSVVLIAIPWATVIYSTRKNKKQEI